MLTDTHCHFEDERYEDDREQVAAENLKELAFAIDVANQASDFSTIVSLTQRFSNLYAALGVHPHFSLRITPDEVVTAIGDLLKDPATDKVVAIGECGLDYYWANQDLEGRTEYEVRNAQANLFEAQMQLAQANNLPLIIHCRDNTDGWDAYIDVCELLTKHNASRGVIHSFSGDTKVAQKFLDLGFYLGLSGIVTFDKTGRLAEVVKTVPLERLLLETDAPYLTPHPHRGQRNEPKFTQLVAEKIAELKEVSIEEVLAATEQNARTLFQIEK